MKTTSKWHPSTLPSQADGAPSPSSLLARHRITDEDLELVRKLGADLVPQLGKFIEQFYLWLADQPEYREFFSNIDRVHAVQRAQVGYWERFFGANIDDSYLLERWQVGMRHAEIGLSLGTYCASVDVALSIFADELADPKILGDAHPRAVRAMTKLLHLDMAVVVDVYTRAELDKHGRQARALNEMSTPVTALADEILLLPIVGIVDSQRAQDIMTSVLSRVAEVRARMFIIDISGVAVVDTAVANYLIKVARATRLMGCRCILSGLSPAVAQTVIELGIDVTGLETRATLRDAIEEGYRAVGIELRATGG